MLTMPSSRRRMQSKSRAKQSKRNDDRSDRSDGSDRTIDDGSDGSSSDEMSDDGSDGSFQRIHDGSDGSDKGSVRSNPPGHTLGFYDNFPGHGRTPAQLRGELVVYDKYIHWNQKWGKEPAVRRLVAQGRTHEIIAFAGRKKRRATARTFINKGWNFADNETADISIGVRNMIASDAEPRRNLPKELNFGFITLITFNVTDKWDLDIPGLFSAPETISFLFRIAQGSHGLRNNWWLGGESCARSTISTKETDHNMWCTSQSHPNIQVLFGRNTLSNNFSFRLLEARYIKTCADFTQRFDCPRPACAPLGGGAIDQTYLSAKSCAVDLGGGSYMVGSLDFSQVMLHAMSLL